MHAETLLDIAMNHMDPLIEKARKGNNEATNRLVQLWYKRIYNYVFKYFADHDTAMEVTQKTFIKLHTHIGQLKDPTRFKSWLYRIATNYCHDEQRSAGKRWVVSVSDGHGDMEKSEYDPDRQFQKGELTELLGSALSELSHDQREVVIMKEYEGLKFREIADVLKISENTVKSRLSYGLGSLKKILNKKNITKETVYYEI